MTTHYMKNSIPRRIDTTMATPAEAAIRRAMQIVEETGASENLTKAIVKLQEALEHVANHVDDRL